MVDCGDTGTCLIPMGIQYVIVAGAFVLFLLKAFLPRDPYDRM
jgi:hypothetical protein